MSFISSRALRSVVLSAVVALAASELHAQQAPSGPTALVAAVPPSNATVAPAELDEVVVTGTRTTSITSAQSPAPVQVLSPQALQEASGNPDVLQTLAQIVPSLNGEVHGNDMEANTLQLKLRGLSPNDVLVLVNGKRRHTTANLGIDAGPYQGGAGVDLNFIPLDAIDHIEVLTDGAAAQYGSDAIAGVINIILKKSFSGGDIEGTDGGYFDGGGHTGDVDADAGFQPGSSGYLNVSGSDHNHGTALRNGPDPRALSQVSSYPGSNMTQVPGYPYLNKVGSDPEYHTKVAAFNSGYDLEDGISLYAFGTYGHKNSDSNQNYRTPTQAHFTANAVTTYPFAFGFTPAEAIVEDDYQLTGGLKGGLLGWNWDLSSSFGLDHDAVHTDNTINSSVYNTNGQPQPLDFYDGLLGTSQWANTLDVNRNVDVGLAAPLNVAFGIEYRRDTYRIGAGQLLSYDLGGAQAFPGWTPQNAGSWGRENEAGYLDLDFKPLDALRIDAAGRFEHYSDFGNATVGKLTARYDFDRHFAVRGTVSNGFRAPTLAEERYSATNVSPTTAIVQLAPNSPVAQQLGLGDGLKPERSVNYSLGLVWRALPGVLTTLDLYQITLTNRIIGSGTLYGELNGTVTSPNVINAIDASGAPVNSDVSTYGVSLFTNGVDTRTRGADLVFDFPVDYGFANVDWTVGANYNDTALTGVRSTPTPAKSTSALVVNSLYSVSTLDELTTENQLYTINLGGLFTLGRFSVNLLEKIYGPSSEWISDSGDNPTKAVEYFREYIGVTPITNVDFTFRALKSLRLDVGANNAFNRYPNAANRTLIDHYASANNTAAVGIWPSFSPFASDGGFYFAKATYTW